MRIFLFTTLIAFLTLSSSFELQAQRTVERYENGNKKYQGRTTDGVKLGKHTFWYENGEKKREERYNERGILILIREWDEQGNLTKEENPEEGFERIRAKQFEDFDWHDTRSNIEFFKVKGDNGISNPIEGRSHMVIHYATFLTDGKEVDNSFRARQPINVDLKKFDLIDGLIKGLQYFEEGDNGYIRVPAKLAYDEEGTTGVPPDATLVFQVLIIKVS